MIRAWRFVTMVLAALALTTTSAHVLELPQKMQYDPELYSAVNTTMYRYFGTVGAIYCVGALVAAFVLALLVRKHAAAYRWSLIGALLFLGWFLTWIALVVPVNSLIATARDTSPEALPSLWTEMRARWEYGHAFGFVLQLLGFCALVLSVLIDTPQAARVGRGKATEAVRA